MSVTIKDVLELPAYKDCRLIAGSRGIYNIVLYADGMEVPDIKPWLRPHLFMITTGYSIRNLPNAVMQLVLDLHHAGCAALAIKTKFIGEISADVIMAAEELGFPIIVVPDGVPASELFVPLMNLIYSEQDTQLQSNYFFIDLMNGAIRTEEEAKLRIQPIRWPKLPFRLLLFHIENKQRSCNYNEEILKKSLCYFSDKLERYILLPGNDNVSVILSDIYKDDMLTDVCTQVCAYIRQQFGLTVCAGISDRVESYIGLRQGFQDALEAVKIGVIEKSDKTAFQIKDFRLEQVLLDFKGNARLQKCLDETFSALRDHDRRHKSNLMETLSALTASLGSKVNTADRLFLHRNTLIYRINKIEELTGMDLTDSNTISRLSFLFKIQPFL